MNSTQALTFEQRAELIRHHREIASRRENNAHRALENSARAKRLRVDEATRRGLVALWCEARDYVRKRFADKPEWWLGLENAYLQGRTGMTLAEMEEAIAQYNYLSNVPPEAFYADKADYAAYAAGNGPDPRD